MNYQVYNEKEDFKQGGSMLGGGYKGAGANIKVKTNLRIAANKNIVMTSNASFKFKGQNESVPISSAIWFPHGKMGLGSTTTYIGTLAKLLEILDVIEHIKIQSFAKGKADAIGTSRGAYQVFNPENKESTKTKVINVDAKKYRDGVYDAAKKFMTYHT